MPESVGALEIEIQKSANGSTFNLKELKEEISEIKQEVKGGIRGLTTAATHLDRFSKSVKEMDLKKLRQLRNLLAEINNKYKKLNINIKTNIDEGNVKNLTKKTPTPEAERLTEEFVKGATKLDILNLKLDATNEKLAEAMDKNPQDKGKIANLIGQVRQYETQIAKVQKENEKLSKSAEVPTKGFKKLIYALSHFGKQAEKSDKESKSLKDRLKGLGQGALSFAKSIGRIAMYRAIRSAIKGVTQALAEGRDNLYQWAKLQKDASGNAFAKSLDKIASAGQYLKNSIAAAVAPIINTLAPKIESFVNKIVDVVNQINQAVAIISGQDYWYRAKKQTIEFAKSEDQANESAKKLKKTLLGIDELNVLDSNDNNSSTNASNPSYADMFETVPLDKKSQEFQSFFDKLVMGLAIGGATLFAIGAVVAFSGANIPLGIGMMVVGAAEMYEAAKLSDGLSTEMEKWLKVIMTVIGGSLLAIGAIVALTGANLPIGIGLMVAGAAALGTAVAINWKSMETSVGKALQAIMTVIGGAALVVGAILALTGVSLPWGIGLMVGGAAALGTAANVDWDALGDKLKSVWNSIKTWASGIPNSIKIWFHNIKADIGNLLIDIINLISGVFNGGKGIIPDNVFYSKMNYEEDYESQKKKLKDYTLGNYVSDKVYEIKALFSINEEGTKASTLWTTIKNIFSKDGEKSTVTSEGKTSGTKPSSLWESIKNIFSKDGKTATVTANGKRTGTSFSSIWESIKNIFSKDGKTATITAEGKNKGTNTSSIWSNIKNIFSKDKKTMTLTADAKKTDAFKSIFSTTTAKNYGKDFGKDFATGMNNQLKNESIKLNVTTSGKNSIITFTDSLPNAKPHAKGGHPATGELFYANELRHGLPEMVGTVNHQPTVATNPDIVEAVSRGVANAVGQTIGNNYGGGGDTTVTVYLDGDVVYNNVVKHNQQNTIRTGKNAMAY